MQQPNNHGGVEMTYVIEPSTFGIGYSIFRLEVKDGKRVKIYLADAPTISEARQLCPGAAHIFCPSMERAETNKQYSVLR